MTKNIDNIILNLQDAIPTIWMENNLYHPDGFEQKLKLRPAQVEIINEVYSTHRWFAYALGRQCITKDEYIYTHEGPVLVGDVKEGMSIIGGIVRNLHEFEDFVYKISFANGTSIKVNTEHPFYTKRGWVPLKELTLDDCVEFERRRTLTDYDYYLGDNEVINDFHEWYGGYSKHGFSKVVSIEPKGIATVVGWTTQGTNEIISYRGMRTHNSGKTVTICSIALHRANKLKRRVVIVAPSEKNMNIIWDKMKSLLKYNEKMNKQIIRDRQKPAKEITFEDGGWISGAITGVSPSKELVGNRGNSCDDIIVDESAYIPDTAWKVILPYIINSPDGKLILTSTPSPFEDYFFRAFHPEKFTEEEKTMGFNFMTRAYSAPMANPTWSLQTEGMFRIMLTPEEYDREILVQFPKEAGGVFPQAQVEEALADYSYSNEKLPGWRYIMGVDWNQSENGGQICVIGFNDTGFYLANRTSVSNVSNPQTATIKKIIEWNEFWQPEFIFADAGYGSTQIEFLHNYGIQNPKTKLHIRVKAIDFNTDDTIKILVGNDKIKKKPKPFMVGLMQRAFQDRIFKFSKDDIEGKTSLYMQFRNFRIKKQSFGSIPVYDDGYFHSIIAVMICLIGIYKFYSRYSEDYIGPQASYIVPFDKDKLQDTVFYTPETIKAMNKPFNAEESRKHDPKWREFAGLDNGSNVVRRGGSRAGFTRKSIAPMRPRSTFTPSRRTF